MRIMNISSTPIANVNNDGSIEVLRHVFFECSNCTECCKLNNIPATEEDIIKMVENGVEVDQAIEVLSPILIPCPNIENGVTKAYILRKKPFVNECAFLNENNLCNIHEFKPLACKLYPFSIRKLSEGYRAIIHPDCVCEFIKLDVLEEESNTLQILEELLSLLSLD